jgi:hypothetical protein
MTMKLADVAPNEAMLVELAEQLSSAQSPSELRNAILDLDSSYLEAARVMLATLSKGTTAIPNHVSLTSEQIETFLEFDPLFAEEAKAMLREFIEGKERE